jgi:rubrerythrin
MLRIDPAYVAAARSAQSGEELHGLLQNAIRLEHGTIPPYLTAAFSLKLGVNTPIIGIISGIAKEEMLHMAIVANVLNAIGGRPQIDREGFVPTYPGPLPMNIAGGLQVGLKKFSKDLVRDVFMEIEAPEHPIHFRSAAAAAAEFATIGQFYRAVIDKITELGDGIFIGDVARQVVEDAGFHSQQLFAITNVETATRALQRVVKDGEGTTALPLDEDGKLAHYYVFEQIVRGRKLVEDATAPNGYSYTGAEIGFNPEDVWDLPDNPKASDYPAGSPERGKVDAFNAAYSRLLHLLQQAFDGSPGVVLAAVDAMRDLRDLAADVVSTADPRTGKQLGVAFEYVAA